MLETPQSMSLEALVRTLRPHQWVKNLFVLAPLVFSKHLFNGTYALRALIATAAFCAVSGAVYAFNDVRDVEADRQHPVKRYRPIAAGLLSERVALIAAGALATSALVVTGLLDWTVAVAAACYLVVNLSYSLYLKQVAFVDVTLIAIGFLLRVLAGAFAIGVPPSPWLLACTALLAMFLGLGKRAHELHWSIQSGKEVGHTRAALAGYSAGTLRWAIGLVGAATCIAYVLYTLDHHTVAFFGTEHLVWTAPFPALGIARFAWLAFVDVREESPTEAMLRDWPFLAVVATWGVAVLAIVYR